MNWTTRRWQPYALSIASLVAAIAALVLAAIALGTANRALRHQYEPHLVVTSQTEAQFGELGLFLENQGHAPARITEFDIQLDGNPMTDWHAVTAALTERRIQLFPNYEPESRMPVGELIEAGDRIGIYSTPPKRLNVFDLTMIKKLFNKEIGLEIEYCDTQTKCQIYCRNTDNCRD